MGELIKTDASLVLLLIPTPIWAQTDRQHFDVLTKNGTSCAERWKPAHWASAPR